MWAVIATMKATNQRTLFEPVDGLTEEKAERVCEMWGWTCSDGMGHDAWLSMEDLTAGEIAALPSFD